MMAFVILEEKAAETNAGRLVAHALSAGHEYVHRGPAMMACAMIRPESSSDSKHPEIKNVVTQKKTAGLANAAVDIAAKLAGQCLHPASLKKCHRSHNL
jgi:hypothetical protein